jgi:hypothetical protein
MRCPICAAADDRIETLPDSASLLCLECCTIFSADAAESRGGFDPSDSSVNPIQARSFTGGSSGRCGHVFALEEETMEKEVTLEDLKEVTLEDLIEVEEKLAADADLVEIRDILHGFRVCHKRLSRWLGKFEQSSELCQERTEAYMRELTAANLVVGMVLEVTDNEPALHDLPSDEVVKVLRDILDKRATDAAAIVSADE